MKIFKELNKLGYKHYTENTVEELDDLPLDSEERIMEQALVLRWFREKYGLFYDNLNYIGNVWKFTTYSNEDYFQGAEYKTYEEAEIACLIKLIEIVKNGNTNN